MRDVTDDDMDSAARGLRLKNMSGTSLKALITQHVKSWDMFASRVIVQAALRQLDTFAPK